MSLTITLDNEILEQAMLDAVKKLGITVSNKEATNIVFTKHRDRYSVAITLDDVPPPPSVLTRSVDTVQDVVVSGAEAVTRAMSNG